MTDKKTKQAGNLIAVDAGKLASSLQAVFQGVADVFGSIPCDGHSDGEAARISVTVTAGKDAGYNTDASGTGSDNRTGKTAKTVTNPVGKEKGITDGKGNTDAGVSGAAEDGQHEHEAGKPQRANVGILDGDDAGVAGSTDAGAVTEVENAASGTADPDKGEAAENITVAASDVTGDDITKVIVKKIEQNRANSGKIGALLKTYGAAKVSELAPSRYEAFLTDISQL